MLALNRAFLFAGASSVVTSLWSIDDEASAHLMTQFYSQLEHPEMRIAEALRDAQLEMMRHPGWQQPFYWAAFTVTGGF